eukprot:1144870-Pelagomonas_calceolata.AAC.1
MAPARDSLVDELAGVQHPHAGDFQAPQTHFAMCTYNMPSYGRHRPTLPCVHATCLVTSIAPQICSALCSCNMSGYIHCTTDLLCCPRPPGAKVPQMETECSVLHPCPSTTDAP